MCSFKTHKSIVLTNKMKRELLHLTRNKSCDDSSICYCDKNALKILKNENKIFGGYNVKKN